MKCSKEKLEYQRKYRLSNLEKTRTTVRKCHEQRRFGMSRQDVFDRLGPHCFECGSTNRLNIHHKDCSGRKTQLGLESKDTNNCLSNLVILCAHCHGRLHGLVGGRLHGKEF